MFPKYIPLLGTIWVFELGWTGLGWGLGGLGSKGLGTELDTIFGGIFYPVNNVMRRNIKLNIRMMRKGSKPNTMLMMMRKVMAEQRLTAVTRQRCWEQE